MLKKNEWVYRQILTGTEEEKKTRFTQLELSKHFKISLSTVNNALEPLERMGSISKHQRYFSVIDRKKVLLYWATVRNLQKDIIYSTRMNALIKEIENSVPSDAVFTAYTAYKLLYKETPADYSEVYFYLPQTSLPEVKERFPESKGPPNVFVLEGDPFLFRREQHTVPVPQLYVDLWNLKEWYAQEFLNALEKRLKL